MREPEWNRVYMRAYSKKRREAARALLGGACVQCGSGSDLEIDHVVPRSRGFVVTSRICLSWDKVVAELARCQLLCHTCHAAKTFKESKVAVC